MNFSFINNDFLFFLLYFFIITLENINPWVIFVGGVLVIITGIINIIKFIHYLKDRKENKAKSNS